MKRAQASGEKSLINRNVGTGYRVVQERSEEELNVTDTPRYFELPVGVKLADQIHGSFDRPDSRRSVEKTTDEDTTVSDMWSTASTLSKGKNFDVPKKQGLLSSRAASMLEAERDSKTRWSLVMKIQYRGGIYKGRCQGGLPEGRGRLTFQDGSVYDGMWRHGKRSGLGSLFFSNGDVFHGSWRDDLMQCMERDGFTSTRENGGLSIFGKEDPMVKGDFIPSLERSSLANFEMDGEMAAFFVSKLMAEGMSRYGTRAFSRAVRSWTRSILEDIWKEGYQNICGLSIPSVVLFIAPFRGLVCQ